MLSKMYAQTYNERSLDYMEDYYSQLILDAFYTSLGINSITYDVY